MRIEPRFVGSDESLMRAAGVNIVAIKQRINIETECKNIVAQFDLEAEQLLSEIEDERVWQLLIDKFPATLAEKDRKASLKLEKALIDKQAKSVCDFIRRISITYNLTFEDYLNMLVWQGGACAICKLSVDGYRLSVDHDHACCPGKTSCGRCVRGLLCTRCNWTLGRIEVVEGGGSSFDNYLRTCRS